MSEPLFHIVLVEPEIPGNSGNIGRLCAAAGARLHFVGPLGFEISDKAVKRAGLDYWPLLDWKQWPDLESLRQTAEPGAAWHYFTTKTERLHTAARYRKGDYLVFGRESKGLPESLLEANPAACVTIPIRNKGVRSLNLSSSAAIGLYEAMRQVEGWQ